MAELGVTDGVVVWLDRLVQLGVDLPEFHWELLHLLPEYEYLRLFAVLLRLDFDVWECLHQTRRRSELFVDQRVPGFELAVPLLEGLDLCSQRVYVLSPQGYDILVLLLQSEHSLDLAAQILCA